MDTPSDKTARQLMDSAHTGKNISDQYNNLPISEQREVFASMRNLKAHGDFPDLQITGTNDGTLGDMQREKTTMERVAHLYLDDKTQDVYDTRKEQSEKPYQAVVGFVNAGGIGDGSARGAANALQNRNKQIAEALGEQ